MKFKNYISVILLSVVALIYISVIYKYANPIGDILSTNTHIIIIVSFLLFLGISIQAYNYIDILASKNKIPLISTIRIWAASSLTNYIAPFQPGLLVRAKFFKDHGEDYITSSICVVKQLHYNLWIGIGIAALTLPDTNNAFITLKFSLLLLFFLWLPAIRLANKLMGNLIGDSKRHYLAALTTPPTIKQIFSCISQFIITGLAFYILLNSIGVETTFRESLVISVLLILSSLLSITPNNLGVQEIIIGLYIHNNGATGTEFITAPFMFRLCHILTCTAVIAFATLAIKKFTNVR